MFYTAEVFLNASDNYTPVQSCSIQNFYEDFNKAYDAFIGLPHDGETESWCVDQPGYYKNCVVMYIIDNFNEYYRINLIINADEYDNAEDTMIRFADSLVNNILKGRWLDDQFKDLPLWLVIFNYLEGLPLDIFLFKNLNSLYGPYDFYYDEIELSMIENMEHIPTELSHVISAWGDCENYKKQYFELLIRAKDKKEATEVVNDFIRLYVKDEHKQLNNTEMV